MDYIPIIDMAKIDEITNEVTNNQHWISTAQKIREGLGGIGFMYLKNHHIDTSLIEKSFLEAQKFFNLPQTTKLKYKKGQFQGDFHSYNGYTEPGQELLHETSIYELRESYDFMEGYGTYPDSEVPEFNASIIELRKQCHELAKKILVLWAMSLNLEDFQYFLNHCTHIDNLALPRGGNMRAIRYPSIPKDMEIPIGTVRLGEHSDFCMLTFIFQDMIGGLEVRNIDGKWIPATPIADTIIVNTGDLLEKWSSGVFPATKHRVVIPENEELKRKDRFSIAYGLGPNTDTVVSSLKVKKTESEKKRLASQYPAINYDELQPVVAMEYMLDRLVNSYAKR